MYNEIPDNEIDIESPNTEYVKRRLRDNPIGMVGGDAGQVYSPGSFSLVPGEAQVVTPAEYLPVIEQVMTKIAGFVCPMLGTIRTKFTMFVSEGAGSMSGQIYINGAPVGILRTTDSTPQEYIEDIDILTAPCSIEIYLMVDVGSTGTLIKYLLSSNTSWQFTLEFIER